MTKEVKQTQYTYEGPKYWKPKPQSDIWFKLAVGLLILGLLCMAISAPMMIIF